MHLLVNGLLFSSPDQYMNEWLHFVKEPIYVMVVAVFNAIIITVTKQLRNWFGNVQNFEFVDDTRMASFLCRREKGGDCIQDLSLSVVKILLFNKSPITTPFVNKCQKWFSWLAKA